MTTLVKLTIVMAVPKDLDNRKQILENMMGLHAHIGRVLPTGYRLIDGHGGAEIGDTSSLKAWFPAVKR